jgi:hypothetical protein
MKVIINKNQQKINFQKHIGAIVTIAQKKAEAGYDRFSYPIPYNQGINTDYLINAVEKETEQSVYGSVANGIIKFKIRD